MSTLEHITESIITWAETNADVEVLMTYGSFARGDQKPSSDLDLCLLVTPGGTPNKCLKSLEKKALSDIRWSRFRDGKQVYLVGEDMLKVEIIVSSDPKDFAWLADHPDIEKPRLRKLVAKSRRCDALLLRAGSSIPRNKKALFRDEADKFIEYFEAASRSHRRSDSYQFYFHYNLALGCLIRMFSMNSQSGTPRYLFLPKWALTVFNSARREEAREWQNLHGVLYLPEAHERKKNLVSLYLKVASESGEKKWGLSVADIAKRQTLLESLINRDSLFNVRDFSRAYRGAVRSGVLIRSSTLSRWKGQSVLRDFMSKQKIERIIDLRMPDELEKDDNRMAYDEETLRGIDYHHLPVTGALPSKKAKGEYAAGLLAFTREYAEGLKAVAREAAGATVVHCHVGKDRTGIFCACLGTLLGLPRADIVADYALSEQGVHTAKIEAFLDELETLGGIKKHLLEAGLSKEDILQLKSRLLTNNHTL